MSWIFAPGKSLQSLIIHDINDDFLEMVQRLHIHIVIYKSELNLILFQELLTQNSFFSFGLMETLYLIA